MIKALSITVMCAALGCSQAEAKTTQKATNAATPPFGGLAAHASTVFTLLAVDRHVAAALLPPELELMTQTLTPAGQHPLIIQRQHVTGEHVVGSSDTPFDYNEIIVGVPLVQLRGGRTCQGASGPYVYWPILALDDQRAVDLGVQYYAFNKILANIDTTADHFDVTLNGLTLLQSANGTRAVINDVGATNIQLLLPVVSTPLISRRPSGELIWSSVALTSAPVFSALTVDFEAFGAHVHSPSVNESPLGSIEVDYDSLLSPPVVCPR